jgi:hypothetical protein
MLTYESPRRLSLLVNIYYLGWLKAQQTIHKHVRHKHPSEQANKYYNMTENNYISERSLNIGRLFVIVLVLLDLYYFVIHAFIPELIDCSRTFNIVNQFVWYTCVISIWLIIRQIIVKGQSIIKLNIYLILQILLFIITGILSIYLLIVHSRNIELLLIWLSFIGIINYIILTIISIRLSKNKMYFIKNFKKYLILYIIVVFLSLIRMLITGPILHLRIDTIFIDNFLKTIPLIFLFIYFTEYKRRIQMSKNASA